MPAWGPAGAHKVGLQFLPGILILGSHCPWVTQGTDLAVPTPRWCSCPHLDVSPLT